MENDELISYSEQERMLRYLNETLQKAMEIVKADKGNIQFYDEARNCLVLVAAQGFNEEFKKNFREVQPGECACGTALKRRERVIVKEFAKDPVLFHLAPLFLSHGFQAVQSTPLTHQKGEIFGMLSTHFAKPHEPGPQELELLDLYIQDRKEIWKNIQYLIDAYYRDKNTAAISN